MRCKRLLFALIFPVILTSQLTKAHPYLETAIQTLIKALFLYVPTLEDVPNDTKDTKVEASMGSLTGAMTTLIKRVPSVFHTDKQIYGYLVDGEKHKVGSSIYLNGYNHLTPVLYKFTKKAFKDSLESSQILLKAGVDRLKSEGKDEKFAPYFPGGLGDKEEKILDDLVGEHTYAIIKLNEIIDNIPDINALEVSFD